MARAGSNKGRRKKAATKKKRKVAVSRTPQRPPPRGAADNTPSRIANMPVRDTSNLDVANEIAKRHRNQLAATAARQPQQQSASALLAGESSLTADGTLAATDAADTVEVEGEAQPLPIEELADLGYEEMLARIAELEAAVAKLSGPSIPGIGHNNPPPLDSTELDEIKNEISRLKSEPRIPTNPSEARAAARRFSQFGGRVLAWVANQLDIFATEFSKSAGHEAGKAAVQLPKWLLLGSGLMACATGILQWLMRSA